MSGSIAIAECPDTRVGMYRGGLSPSPRRLCWKPPYVIARSCNDRGNLQNHDLGRIRDRRVKFILSNIEGLAKTGLENPLCHCEVAHATAAISEFLE